MSKTWGQLVRSALGSRRALSGRPRRRDLQLEMLEGRALMAILSGVAFDGLGREVTDVVYNTGQLDQFTDSGVQDLGTNAVSASVGFDGLGREYQDVVYSNGQLYQFNDSGVHYLGSNAVSASVAFDGLGREYQDVVYNNGQLYQFNDSGAHYLGTNVLSASVAFDGFGREYQDVIYNDGSLYQFNDSGAFYLGTDAVSASVAFDGAGRVVQDVVYTNGDLYQFTDSGPNLITQLFAPAPPGLSGGYKGVIYDYASDLHGDSAEIQPNSGLNFYLGNISSYSDAEGDNYAGTLTITNWAGDVIQVPFVGKAFFDQSPGLFYVQNVSPSDSVSFLFNFEILPNGSLYANASSLTNGFYVFDNNNDFYDTSDDDSASYYVSLDPNPNGTP